jgi:gliding motility-associated lipoprotein GldH
MSSELPLHLKPFHLKYSFLCIVAIFGLSACVRTELFEKNVAIPGHAWTYSFKPQITFDIQDTSASYHIFVVVRHTDAFRYNNLWVRLKSSAPGDSTVSTQQFDLPLAVQNRWTGTGMDDIFEHRILLYRQPVKFSKPGEFSIVIEQVMRENPLLEMLNIGIRLEKAERS